MLVSHGCCFIKDEYAEALKKGAVPAAYVRLMFMGAGGSGKSSVLDGLMNIPLKTAESTALADTRKVTFQWVQAADSVDDAWKEYTISDEVRSLAGNARFVAEKESNGDVGSSPKHTVVNLSDVFAVKTDKTKNLMSGSVHPEYVKKVSQLKHDTYQNILKEAEHPKVVGGNPSVVMHIWDCGGQPVFLDVLAAFLTPRTMFVLLFDASIDFECMYQEKWHHEGKVINGREQYITHLELLQQWLQLIHSFLVARKEGLPWSNGQPNAGSLPKYPKAMLIGSRRDLISPHEANAAESRLKSACADAAFGDLVVDKLLVDNTKAGKGKEVEDPGYQIIRSHIQKFAQSLIVPTPLSWVAFRQVLQKMSKENPVLTYSQVSVIAKECDIIDELPSVLQFYHQLGAILHYVNIPSLANTVIVEPQWLIEQLRLLLMPAWFGHRPQHLQRFWNWLEEKGILAEELYQEIWKDCGLEGGPQAIADLLEHFDLAKNIHKFPRDMSFYKGLKYFVPCLLKVQPKSEMSSVSQLNPVREAADLHILFNMRYVPPGFFVRLIAHLTNHKEYVPLLDQKEKVYRNSIVFQCREIDRVIVSESLNSISVRIFRMAYRKSSHCYFSDSCTLLRKEISCMCTDVINKWMPSIKDVFAFKCTCQGSSKAHFAPLKFYYRDCILWCDRDHEYQLGPEHRFWLDAPQKPPIDIEVSLYMCYL